MTSHKTEIRALTGLRGFAALWVVMYHVHLDDAFPTFIRNFISHGYLAVDLFFVLSGFVIALTYSHLFEAGMNIRQYKIFLLRRFARIYPLYIVTTALVVLSVVSGFSHALPLPGLMRTFLYNILLVQYWGFAVSINLPAWSISTEFAAYLLFPALLILVTRNRGLALACGIISMAVLWFISQLPTPEAGRLLRHGPLDVYWAFSLWPLLRCLCEFLLGLLTYRLSRSDAVKSVIRKSVFTCGLTVLLLALLVWPNLDLLFIAALMLLILVLFHTTAPIQKLLAAPTMVFLGEISYSLYLLHSQFVRVRPIGTRWLTPYIGDQPATVVSIVVLYASLIYASWLVHHYFEKPARNWVRKFEAAI